MVIRALFDLTLTIVGVYTNAFFANLYDHHISVLGPQKIFPLMLHISALVQSQHRSVLEHVQFWSGLPLWAMSKQFYDPSTFRCIFVVDNRRMRRALYFLLMVWIALQSTLVQAHMVEESLHQLDHSVQMSDIAVTDAEQDESCTMVMCSHPVGAFYSSSQLCWGQLSGTPPSTVLPLESAHALDDIERPKWLLAAPGVAGI